MERRIIALEEKIMFVERQVQQLDEQVRALADDLILARREIASMRAQGNDRHEQLLERLDAAADVPANTNEDGPHTP